MKSNNDSLIKWFAIGITIFAVAELTWAVVLMISDHDTGRILFHLLLVAIALVILRSMQLFERYKDDSKPSSEEEIKYAFNEEFSIDYLNHLDLKGEAYSVEMLWMGFARGYRCGEKKDDE